MIIRSLFFFICPFIFGQLSFNGSIKPLVMFNISDKDRMDLPFRFVQLRSGYTMGDFDILVNSALEHRWGENQNPNIQLREAYLTWFPSWGEVKIGKQIHAWGVADGNNPTDNLNPYDYYYMFLQGADRKIGSVSASIISYWNNWQLEGVVIPNHVSNRLPFNEPEFPFQIPIEPTEYQERQNSLEYGLQLKTILGETDLGISYFEGYDRSFSLLGIDTMNIMQVSPKFGYRSTSVIGLNMVTFIKDSTIRAESALFSTVNDYEAKWYSFLDTKADYLQYVIQIEYRMENSKTIGAQLIGNNVMEATGNTLDLSSMNMTPLNNDNFIPGMGTPFAMISNKSLLIIGSNRFFDDDLELSYNLLFNLEEQGQLLGFNLEYLLNDNWFFNVSANYFIGNDDPINSFEQLEDFSNTQLQLSYTF
ncbi:MAG: hypothetical protein VX818_04950 [Candidatus Neomarinimicrobiota bacterium]|nr:hypothetical protein [Candidatus Neomarinimicrobiota bacterium]